MENEKIVEVLSGWNFWEDDHETGISREEYLSKLDRLVRTDQVIAITGVRRSGKSTLMKQFIKRHIGRGEGRTSFLYVNFEEPKFADMLSLEFLQQIYESYMEIVKPKGIPYILLDEIQSIPKWEKFVRALHEKKEARILISGSTSKLLSKEFGTLLTGRWVDMRIYPLDFREFLRFKGLRLGGKLDLLSRKIQIKQLLREYMEYGGFPLVALKGEKKEILERYFDDIVGRDIAERRRIRNTGKLKALAKYYLTNFSSPISYRRIARFAGLSLDSVERFSLYMTDACLVFFVPKFSYSLKEQEVNPRKVYGIDSGLINTVSFRFLDNIGKLYENLVFLSLLNRGKEIYYFKGRQECDFLVKEGRKVTAIQVSYQIKENEEREVKGLLEAMKKCKLREGLVITEEKEGGRKVKHKGRSYNITFIPLWKWLLAAK
ncbi:MAG: ATP-binding protein [Candidatus Aenigmarchaeota archaeon]|nr:ATP-binding protein [Candidatus Aenigmarchaeota archaeon]